MIKIRIFKSELYRTPIFFGVYSVMCPICSVISNICPCYSKGQGTAVPHRLSYCNHPLESNTAILIAGIPREL